MEWRFFTENALENRRECLDYKVFFKLRLDVKLTVKSRLDGETPFPDGPVNVARIFSLRSGLDKSEIINAHLPEAKPKLPSLGLLAACQLFQICLDCFKVDEDITCIGLAPTARLVD